MNIIQLWVREISSAFFQEANFRDLPGVIVYPENIARLDHTKERILLPSGNRPSGKMLAARHR
jgi:hypothetical protein